MGQPSPINIVLKHKHCSVGENDGKYQVLGHPVHDDANGGAYWERNPVTVHWDVEIGRAHV